MSITIPPEVVEAAARAILEDDGWTWKHATEARRAVYHRRARAAIRAALAAWPGMEYDPAMCERGNDFIILPLTQEARDEPV